ncbi:MAG: hypothetical protein ACRDWN_05970, partial [Acidimicrobiales bacterium]
HKITPVTTGITTAATWPVGNGRRFGFSASMTGGATGSPVLQGALSSTDFAGYTTAGQTVLKDTGPTGTTPVKLTLNNKVQIDYATAAGTYHDTITYTVTPKY